MNIAYINITEENEQMTITVTRNGEAEKIQTSKVTAEIVVAAQVKNLKREGFHIYKMTGLGEE